MHISPTHRNMHGPHGNRNPFPNSCWTDADRQRFNWQRHSRYVDHSPVGWIIAMWWLCLIADTSCGRQSLCWSIEDPMSVFSNITSVLHHSIKLCSWFVMPYRRIFACSCLSLCGLCLHRCSILQVSSWSLPLGTPGGLPSPYIGHHHCC